MLKRITRSKVVYCVIGFIILALAGVIITSTYVGIEASSGSPMPNSATGIYKEAFASETSPGSVVSEPDEETGKLPILSIFNKDKDTIKVNNST